MSMCLRLRPTSTPLLLSLPTHFPLPPKINLNSLSFRPRAAAAATMSLSSGPPPPPQPTVEHVVLFKVKPDTDPSKISAMISGLNSLASLDSVLHLSAGPLLRTRSLSFPFTHLLHSRYASKEDLSSYSLNPSHLTVVKDSVLPICDDIMAVDWLAHGLGAPVSPPPGSALRLSFLKLKEGLGVEVKSEVLASVEGIKDGFGQITQLSVGENFSPARAKGFSVASLAVFPGVNELEAVDSDKEALESHKGKVRGYLESVIVVDYVVSLPQSASL